jgi:hypothetical protein
MYHLQFGIVFFLPFYTLEKGWVLVIPLFTLTGSFTVDHVLIN